MRQEQDRRLSRKGTANTYSVTASATWRTHHLRINMLLKESQESRFLLPPFLDSIIIQRHQKMPVPGQHDHIYLLGFCEPLAAD